MSDQYFDNVVSLVPGGDPDGATTGTDWIGNTVTSINGTWYSDNFTLFESTSIEGSYSYGSTMRVTEENPSDFTTTAGEPWTLDWWNYMGSVGGCVFFWLDDGGNDIEVGMFNDDFYVSTASVTNACFEDNWWVPRHNRWVFCSVTYDGFYLNMWGEGTFLDRRAVGGTIALTQSYYDINGYGGGSGGSRNNYMEQARFTKGIDRYNGLTGPHTIPTEAFQKTAPPVITVQPVDVSTVVEGETATFTIDATPVTVNYQWLKNGVAILNETGKTLNVVAEIGGESDVYKCLVDDGLVVIESNEVSILEITTDLSYTINFDPYRDPVFKRGEVVLSRPLREGERIQIERFTPTTKTYDAVALLPFDSDAFEIQLDRICMIEQEIEGSMCDCRDDISLTPYNPDYLCALNVWVWPLNDILGEDEPAGTNGILYGVCETSPITTPLRTAEKSYLDPQPSLYPNVPFNGIPNFSTGYQSDRLNDPFAEVYQVPYTYSGLREPMLWRGGDKGKDPNPNIGPYLGELSFGCSYGRLRGDLSTYRMIVYAEVGDSQNRNVQMWIQDGQLVYDHHMSIYVSGGESNSTVVLDPNFGIPPTIMVRIRLVTEQFADTFWYITGQDVEVNGVLYHVPYTEPVRNEYGSGPNVLETPPEDPDYIEPGQPIISESASITHNYWRDLSNQPAYQAVDAQMMWLAPRWLDNNDYYGILNRAIAYYEVEED